MDSSEEISRRLGAAHVDLDPLDTVGLLAGAIARGAAPGSPALPRLVCSVALPGEPPSGMLTAALTDLALKVGALLREDGPGDWPLPAGEGRLGGLAALAAGLIEGLTLPHEGLPGPLSGNDDLVLTLQEISRVDPGSECDEDDLGEVLAYLTQSLRRLLGHRAAAAAAAAPASHPAPPRPPQT
ncbi:MAG: hypothetical protein K6A65_07745 [Succinivibrionaceae bacterium]|nr:hypothetical protein [Succinivibrionaceae bacterium]